MKTKYVRHSLISPHVSFHNDRTMGTVTLLVKNGKWEKGKRASSWYSLPLGVQHGQVEIDEFEVTCRGCVVPPPQLTVEPLRHTSHTHVHFHTHLRYLTLNTHKSVLQCYLIVVPTTKWKKIYIRLWRSSTTTKWKRFL